MTDRIVWALNWQEPWQVGIKKVQGSLNPAPLAIAFSKLVVCSIRNRGMGSI